MKDIQELINTSNTYKNVIVQQRFTSKKNTVALVTYNTKPRVFKWFAPGFSNNMNKEYQLLQQAAGTLYTPAVFEKDEKNNLLILEYIKGKNVCEFINSADVPVERKQDILKDLAHWFIKFHDFFKGKDTFMIHNDANLRNFITNTRIWGFDLETCRTGQPVEDIAGICTSLLTTTPMFTTEKHHLCLIFIQEYNTCAPGRLKEIKKTTAYVLREKSMYRRQEKTLLETYAKIIEEDGFIIR